MPERRLHSSKALLDSSELYDVAVHKLARHGIRVGTSHSISPTMLKRKDGVVKSLTDGVAFLFKKNKITFLLWRRDAPTAARTSK